MQREFAKRNVIPNASYPLYASKEGSLDYLFTGKHEQVFGLPRSCLTCTGHGKCLDMTAYVSQIFLFFFLKRWTRQDLVGTWPVLPKKKNLQHTISHTHLLPLPLTLISSTANLLPIPIFSSSPLALSISLLQFPPLPLFLFCLCLFSLYFFNYLFFLFHTITRVKLFYLQPST